MENGFNTPGSGTDGTRNSEKTRKRLIAAVGTVMNKYGFAGLGVNRIAREAGVDKKLIYRYFTSADKLIEAFVSANDYWIQLSEQRDSPPVPDADGLHSVISDLLVGQFDYVFDNPDTQKLILWGLDGSSIMKSISGVREHLLENYLEIADEYFTGTGINFRSLIALLSSGINFMVLHAGITAYCRVDLKEPSHREELRRTIRLVIHTAFEQAKNSKKT